MTRRSRWGGPSAGLLLALLWGVPATAQWGCLPEQVCVPNPDPPTMERDATRDEILVLGTNVVLGGLTGGLGRWWGGGSFLDGFWRGALGGAGTHAGKRIAASDAPGAGLLGRTVAATGASVTRNAVEGSGSFDRLLLPVGPVRVRWRPGEGEWRASLDLAAAGSIAWAYLGGFGAELDLPRTLASGTPVFRAMDWNQDWGWHGRHAYGTVILRGDRSVLGGYDRFMRKALAHERVHVLQYDQAYILWGELFEDAVLRRIGAPEGLIRSFDLSLHGPAIGVLERTIAHDRRPWEFEANALADTFWERGDG